MKLFDHKNPDHLRILTEELTRAALILKEAYSADRLWGNMTPDERKSALYVAKCPDPEEYLSKPWDDIPADMQDLIDLSQFERAVNTQSGRSYYRGTKHAMTLDPLANRFVMAFLKPLNKAAIEELTNQEMLDLNVKLWRFVKRNEPKRMYDPNKSGLDADSYKAGQGRGGWQGD